MAQGAHRIDDVTLLKQPDKVLAKVQAFLARKAQTKSKETGPQWNTLSSPS